MRERIVERRELDATARASLLRRIVHAHPGATIVAFSRYAATIEALWRALRTEVGVVALTARGVRSAGGGLSRAEVLARLASRDGQHRQAPLRLVLSTDLLGEGLDLLAASVIVHLDQAWTPARMTQREGRAARLGSLHTHVSVYAVRPPAGAARVLAIADRLHCKREAMQMSVAPGAQREQLVAMARAWSLPPSRDSDGNDPRRGHPRVAAVRAAREGWIAVVEGAAGRRLLVAGD
ncbi:MAG: hypothetical protein H3C62_13580, partial [Gemmatimonadaceae bacterium]|nr:hypothetical protein [Gemmatimonadaceae bacterium]